MYTAKYFKELARKGCCMSLSQYYINTTSILQLHYSDITFAHEGSVFIKSQQASFLMDP